MLPLLIVIAVLIGIILFLIFPSVSRKNRLKPLEGKCFAHRGLHNKEKGIPENSIYAFLKAVENGFGIECDIRLTKDNKVVVFHDESLKRLCGEDKNVCDLTLKELKNYKLLDTSEQIPTFTELLDAVSGRVPLIIEIKHSKFSAEHEYKTIWKILKDYKGEYYVKSFFPNVIAQCRKVSPNVLRGQLSSAYYKGDLKGKLLGSLLINFISRPDFISYEHKYRNNFFLRLAVLLGGYPMCWTVRSEEELKNAKKFFKTFIFENFIPSEDNKKCVL